MLSQKICTDVPFIQKCANLGSAGIVVMVDEWVRADNPEIQN